MTTIRKTHQPADALDWNEAMVLVQKMYDDGIDMPIFVEATRQFDRIYSQRGLFLLWGKDELPLEKILKNQ